ncbi:MAG: outer membrane protein [Devosia sp.]
MKTLLLAAGLSVALMSAAQASDLIIADAPVAGVVQGNWDGGFVGVFGGGALADLEFPSIEPVPFSLEPEGWMLGVDAGFNFALGSGLVLGVVGDIAWADIEDGFGLGPSGISSTIDWVGSLRARVGYDAGNYMPYLTAGLAAAHHTLEFTGVGGGEGGPEPFSADATHLGWTIGAGVEFAVADNLSIDAAYRYNNYGTASYAGPDETFGGDFGLTSHQLTVGLHYGF